MTLEPITYLIAGILMGVVLSGLAQHLYLALELNKVRLLAQRAEILVELLTERTNTMVDNLDTAMDDLEIRVIHLESVTFVDEDESDYEAPMLSPYGEVPGWKGEYERETH